MTRPLAVILFGLAVICGGVAMVHVAAGVIASGCALVGVGVFLDLSEDEGES